LDYRPYTFLLCLALLSCGQGKHPGYTDAGAQLFYKLHRFGDTEKKIKNGDYVKAVIQYTDSAGRLLQETPNSPDGSTIFQYVANHDLPLSGALVYFSEGDSASVINEKWKIKADIRIVKVMTKQEYELEQKRMAELGELEENRRLQRYLRENGLRPDTLGNGAFLLEKEEGKGPGVKAGRKVLVSYKGFFLNGRCFDSAAVKHPLEFTYGAEGQVIEGLELLLGTMREGGKSKIILPSHLAFGGQGSSTGIVPPFSTLIYEVELLKVETNE